MPLWMPLWGGVSCLSICEDTRGKPRTGWRDYISQVAWERLRILLGGVGGSGREEESVLTEMCD